MAKEQVGERVEEMTDGCSSAGASLIWSFTDESTVKRNMCM